MEFMQFELPTAALNPSKALRTKQTVWQTDLQLVADHHWSASDSLVVGGSTR